ncbi:pilin protein [Stenotrophomonas maltophilia]|nr:pilin protein [Stenotrophomonas maltophilia]
MAVLCALVVLAPRAMAQRPPETHPTSEHRDIVMSWDRSAMPGDIELWATRTVMGYSSDESLQYGRIHLTCESESSSSTGMCPVTGVESLGSGPASILLRVVEGRSGLTADLRVMASLSRALGERACGLDFWLSEKRPIWTSRQEECGGEKAIGTSVELLLPVGELDQLVAGHWSGKLILNLRTDPSSMVVAVNTFKFDFTITDYNAVSIYFPLFDQVTPHVGLNLQYDPLAQTVGGSTQLDMCLYDGLGSQSQYLGVTVRDSGPRPPGPSGYSVWHTDGGSDATQRVDYTVTLDHNGSAVPLRNGVEQLLHGIDTAKLRLVLLPGMTQPVFCVPTPLTLETPRVPVSSKRPGYYDGDLKVELRVPTVTP